MQSVKQLHISNTNKQEFYKSLHPVLGCDKTQLFDLDNEHTQIIAIDCCGWYYKKIFNREIIMLETLTKVKDFELDRTQFTKLIDDRNNDLVWPGLLDTEQSVIVLDQTTILKYKSVQEITSIVGNICSHYNPLKIFLRGRLQFVDESAMIDKFYTWFQFSIPNYVIVKFLYDTDNMNYEIRLKKKE